MRLQILLAPAIASIVIACQATAVMEDRSGTHSGDGDSTGKIDPNNLLEDSDILGGGSVTTEQVQAFLDQNGSALASHSEDGISAAQLIVDRSHEEGINPVYMLARIQGESSLVESGSSNNLDKATGCGCPDGKGCDAQYKGFGNQVTCGARLIKKYFTQMDSGNATTAGYTVGTELSTLDNCSVTPANRATTALYTYTPWVGSYGDGCGTSNTLGSSGIAHIARKYKSSFPNSADDTTTPSPSTTTPAPSTTTPAPTTPPSTTVPSSDCVPTAQAEVCRAAQVQCGPVVDNCGKVVDCNVVPGFGCKSNEICFGVSCFAKSTTPPGSTPPPSTPPGKTVGDPPKKKTTDTDSPTVHSPTPETDPTQDEKTPAKKTKEPAKKKPKQVSSGGSCSAAPGEGGTEAPFSALLGLLGLVLVRRRSSRG